MIKKLSIQNFKSIKELSLDCRRVNLFIGEPNTGKSNLLEALALFCMPDSENISRFVRFDDLSNLFFENELFSNEILVQMDGGTFKVTYTDDEFNFRFFQNSSSLGDVKRSFNGTLVSNSSRITDYSGIRPYFFKGIRQFPEKQLDFLMPPNGQNLSFLLQTNKSLRSLISNFIQERGFKLTFRAASSEILISKEENDTIISYPFTVMSDTLQRMIFYVAAMETNKEAILVFEEPESNIFPYYTKYLAEKIAYSDKAQYFLTTHNPYFLQSLIQKTPVVDLQVNIVDMHEYKTTVRPIVDQTEIEELIDLDSNVFLNLDKFLSE